MKPQEWRGRRFELVMATEEGREGSVLELKDLDDPGADSVLKVVPQDGGAFEFVANGSLSVPLEAVEHLVRAVRTQLPPTS